MERRRRRVRGSKVGPSKRQSDVYFQPNDLLRTPTVLKQANEWHGSNSLDDMRRLAAELNVNSAGERTGDLSPMRGRDFEESSWSLSPASSSSPSPEKLGQQMSKKTGNRTTVTWPADYEGGGGASTESNMRSRKGMFYDKAQRMAVRTAGGVTSKVSRVSSRLHRTTSGVSSRLHRTTSRVLDSVKQKMHRSPSGAGAIDGSGGSGDLQEPLSGKDDFVGGSEQYEQEYILPRSLSSFLHGSTSGSTSGPHNDLEADIGAQSATVVMKSESGMLLPKGTSEESDTSLALRSAKQKLVDGIITEDEYQQVVTAHRQHDVESQSPQSTKHIAADEVSSIAVEPVAEGGEKAVDKETDEDAGEIGNVNKRNAQWLSIQAQPGAGAEASPGGTKRTLERTVHLSTSGKFRNPTGSNKQVSEDGGDSGTSSIGTSIDSSNSPDPSRTSRTISGSSGRTALQRVS